MCVSVARAKTSRACVLAVDGHATVVFDVRQLLLSVKGHKGVRKLRGESHVKRRT